MRNEHYPSKNIHLLQFDVWDVNSISLASFRWLVYFVAWMVLAIYRWFELSFAHHSGGALSRFFCACAPAIVIQRRRTTHMQLRDRRCCDRDIWSSLSLRSLSERISAVSKSSLSLELQTMCNLPTTSCMLLLMSWLAAYWRSGSEFTIAGEGLHTRWWPLGILAFYLHSGPQISVFVFNVTIFHILTFILPTSSLILCTAEHTPRQGCKMCVITL